MDPLGYQQRCRFLVVVGARRAAWVESKWASTRDLMQTRYSNLMTVAQRPAMDDSILTYWRGESSDQSLMMDEDGRDSEAVVVARQLPRSYQTDSKT